MFNFQKFEAYGSSFAPKISLRNNGQIGISQGALRKMGIFGEGRFVVLYYDADARVIGIKPAADKSDPAAIPVHVRPASKDGKGTSVTAHLSGRSFLEYYGIRYKDRKRSYEPEWNDEHKMFIVDLNKEAGGRKRRLTASDGAEAEASASGEADEPGAREDAEGSGDGA